MISVLENIYRSIARPSPEKPKPKLAPTELHVTREELNAFLAHQVRATPKQLQQILERQKEFGLTDSQRDAGDVRSVSCRNSGLQNQLIFSAPSLHSVS
jgi:hypothetical protein